MCDCFSGEWDYCYGQRKEKKLCFREQVSLNWSLRDTERSSFAVEPRLLHGTMQANGGI